MIYVESFPDYFVGKNVPGGAEIYKVGV